MANTDAGFSIPVGFTDREALRQLNRFVSSAEAGFRKAERTAVRSNQRIAKSSTGMSRQSTAAMQNVSFQLQDIFVQISSGQGVTRALSQQLPQLASGFGLVGAAVGLAAAALIPLAGSLLDFESSSDAVKTSTDELREALKAYQAAEAEANLTTEERISKFGRMATAMSVVAEANLTASRGDVERALAASQGVLISQTGELIELQRNLAVAQEQANNPENMYDMSTAIETLNAALNDQLDRLGLTREEGERFASLITSAQMAEGAENQARAWADVGVFIAESVDGTSSLADETRKVGAEIRTNTEVLAEFTAGTETSAVEAAAIAEAIRTIDWANAISGGQGFNYVLNQALGSLNAIQAGIASRLQSGITDKAIQDSTAGGFTPNFTRFAIQSPELTAPAGVSAITAGPLFKPPKATSGGGGGSRAAAAKEAFDFLEALNAEMEGLQREQELLGLTSEQIAVQEAKWKALDAAKKAGITVTDEMRAKIDEQAESVGRLTGELERAEIAQQQFDQAIDGVADAMAGALVAGESLRDGLAQVLKGIASDIINSGIRNALTSQFGGGGGGWLGGIGRFLTGDPLTGALRGAGLPAFDGGGFTGMGGRSGGIDGKGGFPAILHPNETVVDHTRGQGTASMSYSPSIVVQGDASEKTLGLIENALDRDRAQFFSRWTAAQKQFGNRIA